jgi:hypothetical protein
MACACSPNAPGRGSRFSLVGGLGGFLNVLGFTTHNHTVLANNLGCVAGVGEYLLSSDAAVLE